MKDDPLPEQMPELSVPLLASGLESIVALGNRFGGSVIVRRAFVDCL